MGFRNGVRGSVGCVAGRTPCVAADDIDRHGVFRLHFVIGFADDKVPLKMTVL